MNEQEIDSFGVYCIKNQVNGKVYVGSTARSFKIRWIRHRCELRGNRHYNSHLQAAWNKYGETAFIFIILEKLSNPALIVGAEQHWIDFYMSVGETYNIASIVVGSLGYNAKVYPAFRHRETGEIIPAGFNLSALCRVRGFTHEGMRSLIHGIYKYYRGWALVSTTEEEIEEAFRLGRQQTIAGHVKPYPAFYHRITGEVIPAGENLAALCRERGLNGACMHNLLHGKQRSHKDWMLGENQC